MLNLVRLLLLLTIFLIPLLGPGEYGYEQTKVIFFIIFTSISGLIWLYLLSKEKVELKWSKINLIALGFIAWLLVSSLFGLDPLTSIFGSQPYLQGWILYLYLYLFFLIVSSVKIPIKTLALVLTISTTVVSIVAIRQAVELYLLGIQIPNYAGRVVSTFGQPNLYSGFILLTLPFTYLLFNRKINLVYFTVLFLQIIAIFFSESRAAILGLLVLSVVWLLAKLKGQKIWIKISAGILILLLLPIVSTRFYHAVWQKEFFFTPTVEWYFHNSPEKRNLLWPVFIKLIKERPIFGYGLENIPIAYQDFFSKINFNTLKNPLYHSLKNVSIDRAHNYILDLLMFSGVVGLACWMGLIYILFKKTKRSFLAVCLTLYLMWITFQIQGMSHLIYFWLIAGVVASKNFKSNY